jgi:CBS-domain-containing membrane protein
MTLDKYIHRLVVMHPDATAYDAIRAMEDNHIGAVVVQEAGVVLGIATDRDLALQVISFDQDPLELRLRTVMSRPMEVIPVEASPAEAARMMLERHVRRLPIVSGAKLVGMVTLDDLIVDGGVDPGLIAAVVRAQLAEPSRLKCAGQRGPVARARCAAPAKVRIGKRCRGPSLRESRRALARQLRREVAGAFHRLTRG